MCLAICVLLIYNMVRNVSIPFLEVLSITGGNLKYTSS